jgi:phospholipid/cholesterol/gamma-HCH transport system substrate-binding protein
VRSVRVSGDHVEVRFTVRKGLALGGGSTATVEVATVLGELFLQVESFGPGRLRPGDVIPIARTTVPYTLLDAFGAFGQTAGDVDLPTLQKSLGQLTATLSGISSKDLKATLNGLTRLARVVGDRQSEVATLLSDAQTIAATLQKRGSALVHILDDGDTFVRMLTERRDVIDRLLADTADLGKEVGQLIEKDGAPLTSLLHNIDEISGVLAQNRAQLQAAIKNLSQFSVNIANASGNGPWVDLLLPTLVEPDNVIAACGTKPTHGCGG